MSNAHWLESSIIFSKDDNSFSEIPTKLEGRAIGCLLGGAIGDAFGCQITPKDNYGTMSKHPIQELLSTTPEGAYWTDSTSITLALSASLIIHRKFQPYDQLVRYKRWWKHGYLAATGRAVGISRSMRESLERFGVRQSALSHSLNYRDIDDMNRCISGQEVEHTKFNFRCGSLLYLDNSPLCRIAPIALFFHSRNQPASVAISYAALSAEQTHNDHRCIDACRYLCAIFMSILEDSKKQAILHEDFAKKCYLQGWFGANRLHYLVEKVAKGSYRKYDGYDGGIRSTHTDILASLESILWTLWKDNDNYEQGIVKIVQLGDDASRVATVYGQIAGCLYGVENIPKRWIDKIYAPKFLESVARELIKTSHTKKKISNESSDQNLESQQIEEEHQSLWVKLFGKRRSNKSQIDERPLNFGQGFNDD